MNSDLRQFATHYLSLVFATLMAVSFFAFLAIPYSLGGHPGDDALAQNPTPATVAAPQVQAAQPVA